MSKQDRQGARTPADLERRYDLGGMSIASQNDAKLETQIANLAQMLSQYMADTNAILAELSEQMSAQSLINESVGVLITLTDSSESKLKGLTLYGKSIQNGTEIVSVGTSLGYIHVFFESEEGYIRTLSMESPHYGLMGVPVPSGGNFTDGNGQQWICDEIDFERGVIISRIGVIDSWDDNYVGDYYISSTGSLTQGATVIYPYVDDPLENNLPEGVIEAYKNLRTFYPTTHVSVSDAIECTAKIRYVADLKNYIDGKMG